MTHGEIRDRLIAQRVVPVLRLASAELTERAVGCLADAGFTTVEITMTTPGAVELIRRLARSLGPGFLVGAGTVLDPDTARRCVDAGARFLVSPVHRARDGAGGPCRRMRRSRRRLHADRDPDRTSRRG